MDDLEGESQELWLVQPPSLIGCLQRRSSRPASDLKSSSISRRSERACTEMTRSASDDLSPVSLHCSRANGSAEDVPLGASWSYEAISLSHG